MGGRWKGGGDGERLRWMICRGDGVPSRIAASRLGEIEIEKPQIDKKS